MKELKNDLRYLVVILAINTLLQVLNDSTAVIGVKISFIFVTAILAIVGCIGIMHKDNTKLQYGIVIYTFVTVVFTVGSSATGLINGFNTAYGFIWVVTVASYILSLSHPVISMLMLCVSMLSTFVVQMVSGSSVAESFNSISGLLLIAVVALIIYVIAANKQIDKKDNFKTKLYSIVLYERKPLKIKMWTQIIIWSLIITSVSYIARTQLYEVMNSDMRYVLLAAASVTITTFLTIGAITTSVFVVELFGVYTILEWYTLSYLIFIPGSGVHAELATVLVDTAILGYMIVKYRKQTKMHIEQKESEVKK